MLSFALVMGVSCESDDTEVTPEVDAATLWFEVDGSVKSSATIASDLGATTSVSLISNQEDSTLAASVDSSASDWCEATISGSTLTLTALSENKTDDPSRQAIITVTAGEGDNTASKEFTLTQIIRDNATLSFNLESVEFENEAGLSQKVAVYTNQDSVSIELDNETDFSATLSGKVITITTLAVNDSFTTELTGTLTVTVGEGDNTATEEIIITQETQEDATLTLSKSEVSLVNEKDRSSSVTVTTNLDESTITAELTEGTNFTVSVSGTTITVRATGVNTQASGDLTDIVTVTAGQSDYTKTETFSVTQSNEIIFNATPSSTIELDGPAGSYEDIYLSTNLANIEATITDGADLFSASVSESTLTITTLTTNKTTENYSGVVTIKVSEGELSDEMTIAISQKPSVPEIGDYLDGGIVFWISSDETQAKIMSIDETYEYYAATDTTTDLGASDYYDGAANTAAVMAHENYTAEAFPAFAWCANHGEGWYMPAADELDDLVMTLCNNEMNTKLAAAGYDEMLVNQYYWASTESSTIAKVYAVKVSSLTSTSASIGTYSRANDRYIRAIKVVDL